eukprot:jgi/Mesvir1/14094/Mv25613-RA.1
MRLGLGRALLGIFGPAVRLAVSRTLAVTTRGRLSAGRVHPPRRLRSRRGCRRLSMRRGQPAGAAQLVLRLKEENLGLLERKIVTHENGREKRAIFGGQAVE